MNRFDADGHLQKTKEKSTLNKVTIYIKYRLHLRPVVLQQDVSRTVLPLRTFWISTSTSNLQQWVVICYISRGGSWFWSCTCES